MRWVWFRPWPGGGHGAVFLWLALSLTGAVAAPPNDNFANGQLLTGAVGVVGGSNVDADKEAGEPDHAGNAGGHSVWYRWQANCSGTMTFDIDGSDFPALLAVYTGSGVSSLTEVASAVGDQVHLELVPGRVYHIAVDGVDGAAGNVMLHWNQTLSGTNGPDLIVWAPAMNPFIEQRYIPANDCQVLEGCIPVEAGLRRLLRFTMETRNIGNEDLVFGPPANSPLFEYANCHRHYHFAFFSTYRLLNSSGVPVAVGKKNGFCLENVVPWSLDAGPDAGYTCNNQGIQAGWADIYGSTLFCQFIDITGVPAGDYTLEVQLDPMNRIVETDDANNIATVSVTIDASCVTPPDNDNFAAAQMISGRIATIQGITSCASRQPGEPKHAGVFGGHSLWYEWIAPYTGDVVISTEGSGFDTVLAVYTGAALNALNSIAANDDIETPTNPQSRVSFQCAEAVVYKIAVDGFDGDHGFLQLNMNPAANDDFDQCQMLTGASGSVSGFSRDATRQAGEPWHAGYPGTRSLWFCWQPQTDGLATFDTVGSYYDTLLAVYVGDSVDALAPVVSDDDSAGNHTSRATFFASATNVYHIVVDSLLEDYGVMYLNWSTTNVTEPFIVTQPQSAYALVGDTVSLTVSVVGSVPLSYQWTHNGMDLTDGGHITGAHMATLMIDNVQAPDRGVYRVLITNEAGATNSSPASVIVTDPTRVLYPDDALGSPGEPVEVDIRMEARGDEHTVSFSVIFDDNLLANPIAQLGSDLPAGTTLTVDDSLAIDGALGVMIELPAGWTLPAGRWQLIRLIFDVSGQIDAPTSSPLCFEDVPVARNITALNAQPLAATFACNTLVIEPGLEADVDPRPLGDTLIGPDDFLQVGKFAVGSEIPVTVHEFMRADCAPAATRGDGIISVADWVQAGRYAAGLDPLLPMGGPWPSPTPVPWIDNLSPRVVRVVADRLVRGLNNPVSLEFDSQGDENAVGFTLRFDPALLRFKTAALGDGVPGTTLLVNTNHADHGRLGLALACPIGSSISSGTRQIALVTFSVAKATGATTLDFADVPAFRETVDVSATPLAVRYETATPGLVNLLSVSVPEGGLPQLTVNGVPGQSYIIWASTDLIDWITLAVIPNFSSPFEFIDTDAPNYPARFYKVVAP